MSNVVVVQCYNRSLRIKVHLIILLESFEKRVLHQNCQQLIPVYENRGLITVHLLISEIYVD